MYLQYLVLVNRCCYLPLLWESWSWSECGVGIAQIGKIPTPHLLVMGGDTTRNL